MTRTILIAKDRITPEKVDDFDYIYDEYSNFDELLEGLGVNDIPCSTSWEIGIASPELFSKFKKDFAKIYDIFPLIKGFKDIKSIRYHSHFAYGTYLVYNPTDKDIRHLERHMEKDNNAWIAQEKQRMLEKQ